MGADLSNHIKLDADVAFVGPDLGFEGALRLISPAFQWLLQRWYEDVANEDVKATSATIASDRRPPKGADFAYHRAARVSLYRRSHVSHHDGNPHQDACLGEWLCYPGQRVLYHPLRRAEGSPPPSPLPAVVLAVFDYNPSLRAVGSLPYAVLAFTAPVPSNGSDRDDDIAADVAIPMASVMLVSNVVREATLCSLTPATATAMCAGTFTCSAPAAARPGLRPPVLYRRERESEVSCDDADEPDAAYNSNRWPILTHVYVHVFGHCAVLRSNPPCAGRAVQRCEQLQRGVESWMSELVPVLPDFVL